jgi:hypothetical protein
VSRLSGTGSCAHQANKVNMSRAIELSAASRSKATAHDAAIDAG